MSRTEKLYERLEKCEREYSSLLCEEFELLAAGTVRMMSSIVYGSVEPHDSTKFARFIWLEKEIRGLRMKIGEPIHGSIVGMIEEFRQQFSALGVKQRPEIWIHRCKEILKELNALTAKAAAQPRT
jgi:hypothetical protein